MIQTSPLLGIPNPIPESIRPHRLVAFAVALVTFLVSSPFFLLSSNAEAQNPTWDGHVQVSRSSLTVAPGESVDYDVRLSKPPAVNGTPIPSREEWFVMLHMNGVRYQDGEYRDLVITPSFYRTFDNGDWNTWKNFRVTRMSDEEWEMRGGGPRATSVIFDHEVWDHETNCPVHDSGPVTVDLGDDNNGGGNNGGDGNSGGNNGGDGNGDGNSDGNGGGNGGTPPVLLSVADTSGAEGGRLSFMVSLSRPAAGTVAVRYETAGGTAEEGVDYEAATGVLSFGPGVERQIVEVQTRQDGQDEPDETFTVRLSDPDGAVLGNAVGTGTIVDDDAPPPPPPVTVSIADARGAEGGRLSFMVSLSRPAAGTVAVRYETAGGTAEEGVDYEAATGVLSFGPGVERQIVEVQTRQDGQDEPDETFTVRLSDPDGAVLGNAVGTGTIVDDDAPPPPPPVTVSIADARGAEGGRLSFMVSLSRPAAGTVAVRYETAGGTAEEGVDYEAATGVLSFGPGVERQIVEVQTRQDGQDEPDETFTVRLSDPDGAVLGNAVGTGTIVDDDAPPPPPPVTVSIADARGAEGGRLSFMVSLSRPAAGTVAVRYETAGGTAEEGVDYEAATGVLSFGPGVERQIVEVQTRQDGQDEPDETFTVRLSDPDGAVLGNAVGTGTIVDDDAPPPPPPVTVSIADARGAEGGRLSFMVSLSRPAAGTVAVRYETAGGTAEEGVDYEAATGVLSFGPGVERQIVEVQTRQDGQDEPDETFTVRLSDPDGAVLGNAVGTGTIVDNDEAQPVRRAKFDILAEMGRALAFNAARCRIEQMFSDIARGWPKPSTAALLPPAFAGRGLGGARTLDLKQAFGNASYLLPLGDDGNVRLAAWACNDYRRLESSDRGGRTLWHGEVFDMQFGAETRLRPDLLAGVALSQSRSEIDYTIVGGSSGGASYDLRLTGAHPYFGLKPTSDVEIWGTAGFGQGTLRVSDRNGSSFSSDARLATGAFGVNSRVLERGSTTVTAKGEWGLAKLDVSSTAETFAKSAADLRRFRLAAEVDHEEIVPYVGVLAPWGELGLRHDGGDGKTGASLEIGGGLHYRNIEQGWNSEIFGRWLAARGSGRPKERGFGFRFRYDPAAPGFGPWASLAQSWGPTASGVRRLWNDDPEDSTKTGLSAGRLEAELAYGFRAFRGRGASTPYIRFGLTRGDGRIYRLGTRFGVASAATLSLEAARQERLGADDIHAIVLEAAIRF